MKRMRPWLRNGAKRERPTITLTPPTSNGGITYPPRAYTQHQRAVDGHHPLTPYEGPRTVNTMPPR